MKPREEKRVVIIGAGPAGLTAAYELGKAGVKSIVLEKDSVVGGLARTVDHDGYRFDIGGHRFFTKVRAVEDVWREVLSEEEFPARPRLSRIYYDKKFFHYPLRVFSTLRTLGLWNSSLILVSYLRARLRPAEELTFEQWVTNRFGRRLFELFFKTYTEKVWGIPCREITADWAAQRIRGLSLTAALKNAVFRPRDKARVVKTLAEEFHYPLRGPGMMWEAMARLAERRECEVRLGAAVERILWAGDRVEAVAVDTGSRAELVRGSDFISSMPVSELIRKLDPPAPAEVREAAAALHYRDFITVALVVGRSDLFPDNWIYIHDPGVKVGRVQNFKNWSADMVPDQNKTCLGLEYFCFEGDGLWSMTDEDLIALGKRELEAVGLVRAHEVEGGAVVRMPKAYPVYDSGYKQALGVIRGFLGRFENLQLVGRNGTHRYNNQDHSMLTAMLAVENIMGEKHDLWEVNAEAEYGEDLPGGEAGAVSRRGRTVSSQPPVPERVNTNGHGRKGG